MSHSDAEIGDEIQRLLTGRSPGASICPSDVARALEADDADWRALMPRVREVARTLAADGLLAITQQGATLDPHAPLHGAIRLRRGPRYSASR